MTQDLDQPVVETDDAPSGEEGEPHAIGATIRRLRQARGMTLQGLAAASGVSAGMLSQLERDRANPSLRVLTAIRRALGASVAELFEDAQPTQPADPAFVRRADRRGWLELGYLRKELLTPGAPGNAHGLQFMIIHIPPHGNSGGQPLSYPADKGGMVLEGELTLSVNGEEAVLREGDSFLFDSIHPHLFRNPTDRLTRVLWIIGPVRVEGHL